MTKLGMDYPTKWGRGYVARFARNIIHTYFMGPYVRYLTTLEVRGAENIVGDGPFIFVANHASNADTIILMTALPVRARDAPWSPRPVDSFFMNASDAFKTVLVFTRFP